MTTPLHKGDSSWILTSDCPFIDKPGKGERQGRGKGISRFAYLSRFIFLPFFIHLNISAYQRQPNLGQNSGGEGKFSRKGKAKWNTILPRRQMKNRPVLRIELECQVGNHHLLRTEIRDRKGRRSRIISFKIDFMADGPFANCADDEICLWMIVSLEKTENLAHLIAKIRKRWSKI